MKDLKSEYIDILFTTVTQIKEMNHLVDSF